MVVDDRVIDQEIVWLHFKSVYVKIVNDQQRSSIELVIGILQFNSMINAQ